MGLTRLEMFNAVITASSITQAAQKVHRVSSDLTTCIRQLEADPGVELSTRENQYLRPSSARHSPLHYSQQILALVGEAWMVVTGDEPQRPFSLGSLESTTVVRIPAILAHFNQHYPKIHLALSTGPSGTMIDGVLKGTLNAALVDDPLVRPGLEGLPVFPEEMMTVVPYGHTPVDRASGMNGTNVYTFHANCSCRRHSKSWFHANGATPGKTHKMKSHREMLACMIAGAGLVLIPRSILESVPGHQQVSAWPLAERQRWLTTWLVWRQDAKTRQLEMPIALLNEDRQATVSP